MFGDCRVLTNFNKNVFLAYHRPSSQYVALKKISADSYVDEDFKDISEEIKRVLSFSHLNIISFYSVFVDKFDINVILPFFCFGTCEDAMKKYFYTGFPEIICSFILRDVLTGLEYLHRRQIIHRAIKASHILLNQSRAVLTGFREATSLVSNGERVKCLHNLPRNSAKLINWLAPEVLAQNLIGYSEKSDIYMVGIACCEIANGVAPFDDLATTLMLTEKIRGQQPSLLDSSTFPSDEIIAQAVDSGIAIGEALTGDQTRAIYSQRTLSDAFHKFGETCMSRNPDDRLNASQLLQQHSFFKQCRHTSLEEQLRIHLATVDVESTIIESLKSQNSNDDLLNSEIESLNINESAEWDF